MWLGSHSQSPGRLSRLVRRFLASVCALVITAESLQGVELVAFWPDAWIGATLLGLLHALVRPILLILTMPLTLVTLGLSTLLINATLLGLCAWWVEGLTIVDASSALWATILLSCLSPVLTRLFGGLGK